MLQGEIADLPDLLMLRGLAEHPDRPLRFDAIVGYNALMDLDDKAAPSTVITDLLSPVPAWSAWPIAFRATRSDSMRWSTWAGWTTHLADRLRAAEEAIYADADDALVNWDAEDLAAAFDECWPYGALG